MSRNDTYKYELSYEYSGKIRKATLSVVCNPKGVYYWFHFRNSRPALLTKPSGVWLIGDIHPLTADTERSELWFALTRAIDEQILKGKPFEPPL